MRVHAAAGVTQTSAFVQREHCLETPARASSYARLKRVGADLRAGLATVRASEAPISRAGGANTRRMRRAAAARSTRRRSLSQVAANARTARAGGGVGRAGPIAA